MYSFKEGQEVIFTKEALGLKDVKGVVVEPFYQISQSDWPEVIVDYGDGLSTFVNIDDVRPAEDPYEYGATWLGASDTDDSYWDIYATEWGTLEDAQEAAKYATQLGCEGTKIMRRLKAGEPEDYNGI